jgi:hypothetical protein
LRPFFLPFFPRILIRQHPWCQGGGIAQESEFPFITQHLRSFLELQACRGDFSGGPMGVTKRKAEMVSLAKNAFSKGDFRAGNIRTMCKKRRRGRWGESRTQKHVGRDSTKDRLAWRGIHPKPELTITPAALIV